MWDVVEGCLGGYLVSLEVGVVEGGWDGFASGANLYIPQCGKVGPEFSHLATLRRSLVWPGALPRFRMVSGPHYNRLQRPGHSLRILKGKIVRGAVFCTVHGRLWA